VNAITGSSNSKSSLVLSASNVAPLPQALADVLPVVIAVTECLAVLLKKFFRIDDLRGRSECLYTNFHTS
jgi:hypothetical protein